MLFSDEHIQLLLDGEKTETRRRWDESQVIEGNSYRATTDLFTPRTDAPAYITVESVYKEQLHEITDDDAEAEGGYTVEEFRQLWKEMHGEWNPEETIWVVEFTASQTDPRREQ